MATIIELRSAVERLQSEERPDLQAFSELAAALIAQLPLGDQPSGIALRQAALDVARFDPGEPEVPPVDPPVPPSEPAVPTQELVAPAPELPAPLEYRDFLLVTSVVYDAEGKLLARHEVGGLDWLKDGGVRCRSYQIAVRMHKYPNGRTTLDLLKSNDPLVRPELLRRSVLPHRQMSEISTISDTAVWMADANIPCGMVTKSDLVNPRDPEFDNQAQSILNLASPVEGLVQPMLVIQANEIAAETDQDMWLQDCCSMEDLCVYPEPQRTFYLEPVAPGNGMPNSVPDYEARMKAIAWGLCEWLGWRLLTCPTIKCKPKSQAWTSVLGSPFLAQAGRQHGIEVFANLIPLELPDGTPLVDVEGNQTPMWERWQKARAVEAMGAILRR